MHVKIDKRGNDWISLRTISFTRDDIETIRRIPGRRWHPEEKVWAIPYTLSVVDQFLALFRGARIEVGEDLQRECHLFEELEHAREDETEKFSDDADMLLWNLARKDKLRDSLRAKGYSQQTIKAYLGQVDRFYRFARTEQTFAISQLMQIYALQLLNAQLSHAYVNQAISAVKFYLTAVCGVRDTDLSYVRPKKEQKLPKVLSIQEVVSILKALENRKNQAILAITYSSGLRVGEVVRLRVQDLDFSRKTVHVRQGKGRKDRYTLLSDFAVAIVNAYMHEERPEIRLFPGQQRRHFLTERTVQKVFEHACKSAGIQKQVSRNPEASQHPYVASFICHAFVGGWNRSALHSRASRSPKQQNHRVLHPCHDQRRSPNPKPDGSFYRGVKVRKYPSHKSSSRTTS